MVRGPRIGSAERRLARKIEKVNATSHSGFAGMSIVEMMEEALDKAAVKYVAARDKLELPRDQDDAGPMYKLRGEVRGCAIQVAMIRHPLKRYEQAWWGYVKKLEKRAVAKARAVEPSE